jgi:hypothetical protein
LNMISCEAQRHILYSFRAERGENCKVAVARSAEIVFCFHFFQKWATCAHLGAKLWQNTFQMIPHVLFADSDFLLVSKASGQKLLVWVLLRSSY